MFVALKNLRERLRHHRGEAGRQMTRGAERALRTDTYGSADLLRQFRAAALAPELQAGDLPALSELGSHFANAKPLSGAENLSIMASVKRGAARRSWRR